MVIVIIELKGYCFKIVSLYLTGLLQRPKKKSFVTSNLNFDLKPQYTFLVFDDFRARGQNKVQSLLQ